MAAYQKNLWWVRAQGEGHAGRNMDSVSDNWFTRINWPLQRWQEISTSGSGQQGVKKALNQVQLRLGLFEFLRAGLSDLLRLAEDIRG